MWWLFEPEGKCALLCLSCFYLARVHNFFTRIIREIVSIRVEIFLLKGARNLLLVSYASDLVASLHGEKVKRVCRIWLPRCAGKRENNMCVPTDGKQAGMCVPTAFEEFLSNCQT
jgi:hypothetical protein